MVLHPLVIDALGTTCCTRAKVHKDIWRNSPAWVLQELMIALILSTSLLESFHAKEVIKVALYIVKVVVLPPSKSQQPKQILSSKQKPSLPLSSPQPV